MQISQNASGIEHMDQALRESGSRSSGRIVHGRRDGVADEGNEVLADGADHAQASQTFGASETVIATLVAAAEGQALAHIGAAFQIVHC